MAENDPPNARERDGHAEDILLEAPTDDDEPIHFQVPKGGGYAPAIPLEVQDEDDYAENIPLMDRAEDERSESSQSPIAVKNRSRYSRFKECVHAVGQVLKSALPTYCVPSQISSPRDSPTAYLDALRGYAAFFVYIFHLYDRQGEVTWRRYPFVSTLFSGSGMVAVFYVISGYALGYGLLLNMHRREEGPMLHSLASSAFRRYMRLYGSSVMALLITLVLLRLRLYDGVYFIQIYHKNFGAQLLHWFNDVFKFCNPFSANVTDLKDNHPLSSDYLPQMWTIPVEFRGSVFLFAFCTAICKLTPRARMLIMWLIIVVSYCWQAVYIAEFTGGLFIAQLSLCCHPERVAGPPQLPTNNDEKPAQDQSLISRITHVAIFIVGFLLLGEVDDGQAELPLWKQFPWAYLNKAIPFWWPETGRYVFWLGWGSLALVYSLEFYPALQRPLGWKISRYLGDISFGLYAMHVPFGMGIKQQFLDSWRQTHLGDSLWAYMLMALIITVIVITAADYFTKIDRALVRSARRLQDRLFTIWD
ncbi:hypothetical protein PV05_04515 [Exophiala xenobiotica]|uniref:Acyltransferase 3 domain-containing protein n=1 Tax=Exophiala xenobiotica TaxID=348802 RepID=A0A0D2EM26_9EURO|nr:uncharacterized protein PV05_04515 [Exophiala xenobiotica]KIW55790.1 hypothetical protein PV05_04515 [Exophiala xenobiotica]